MKLRLSVCLVAAALLSIGRASAEDIKIATSHLLSYVAVPIMMEKGYLASEGLNPSLAIFDSAQPITVAVVSGSADFGIGGLSAAFYTLAAQGQLRILAAGGREMPGFYNFAVLASNKSVGDGMKTLKELGGRTVAVTQLGSVLQYSVGRIAEKYGIDLATIKITGAQSNSNILSALSGGALDAGLMPGAPAQPLVQKGTIQRLAWVGDVVPGIQTNLVFTSTKVANTKPDTVKRFMAAYRKATRLYHDAVAAPDETRRDGPNLPELLPLLAKFAELTPDQAKDALPWVDGDARLDVADMKHQVAWFKAQGMVKVDVDLDTIIDKRYAEALPTK